MWIRVDFDELCGNYEIDEKKSERREDDEPLTSINDPAPEHLKKIF